MKLWMVGAVGFLGSLTAILLVAEEHVDYAPLLAWITLFRSNGE